MKYVLAFTLFCFACSEAIFKPKPQKFIGTWQISDAEITSRNKEQKLDALIGKRLVLNTDKSVELYDGIAIYKGSWKISTNYFTIDDAGSTYTSDELILQIYNLKGDLSLKGSTESFNKTTITLKGRLNKLNYKYTLIKLPA